LVHNPAIEPDDVRFAVVGDRRNGVDRLSLIGTLDRDSVVLLESEVDGVAHAGGAVVLDLLNLASVDLDAVRALVAMVRRVTDRGCLLFLVHAGDYDREAFDRVGALGVLSADVSEVLSAGAGDWEPISLPPLPWQRERTPGLRILESRS
jgi:anti-anti-sigma regulatory factor